MPELVEQMYCSQQIVIPPKYPYILKRYCKAAIKTQPYDLLRWSFEYFKALSQHRPPPVKLRLEYPIYSTEGGLTRGCLKVLAQQLSMMKDVPQTVVRAAWKGFCLDPVELRRILCLCEVYMRSETVPFLHFIAVAGGLLTKSLTHTMILLCESLTKEADGGSAAIPVAEFTGMYKFLAKIDASKDVKYFNGYREGEEPVPEVVEEVEPEPSIPMPEEEVLSDEYWQIEDGVQKIGLINAHVGRSTKLSNRLNEPPIGKIERSPSVEREAAVEWQNYQLERKGKPLPNPDIDKKLKAISAAKISAAALRDEGIDPEAAEKKPEGIEIKVYDEEEYEIPFEFYGEPISEEAETEDDEEGPPQQDPVLPVPEIEAKPEEEPLKESENIAQIMADRVKEREERIQDLISTFDEIAALVDRYKSANYDLGMVAGRQMSSTSGEFIVQSIEREILAYIDDQIAILPDPDLKKKKAKPEEVAMIRDLLEEFLDDNMDIIVPELEEVEEEEEPIPEVTQVYAVPGIGPPVEAETIIEFIEYAREQSKVQGDMFMPRNIRHFLCPPLENYPDVNYEKHEQIPVGGIITD